GAGPPPTPATTLSICAGGATGTLPIHSPAAGSRASRVSDAGLSVIEVHIAWRLSLAPLTRSADLPQARGELRLGVVRRVEALADDALGQQLLGRDVSGLA